MFFGMVSDSFDTINSVDETTSFYEMKTWKGTNLTCEIMAGTPQNGSPVIDL